MLFQFKQLNISFNVELRIFQCVSGECGIAEERTELESLERERRKAGVYFNSSASPRHVTLSKLFLVN